MCSNDLGVSWGRSLQWIHCRNDRTHSCGRCSLWIYLCYGDVTAATLWETEWWNMRSWKTMFQRLCSTLLSSIVAVWGYFLFTTNFVDNTQCIWKHDWFSLISRLQQLMHQEWYCRFLIVSKFKHSVFIFCSHVTVLMAKTNNHLCECLLSGGSFAPFWCHTRSKICLMFKSLYFPKGQNKQKEVRRHRLVSVLA